MSWCHCGIPGAMLCNWWPHLQLQLTSWEVVFHKKIVIPLMSDSIVNITAAAKVLSLVSGIEFITAKNARGSMRFYFPKAQHSVLVRNRLFNMWRMSNIRITKRITGHHLLNLNAEFMHVLVQLRTVMLLSFPILKVVKRIPRVRLWIFCRTYQLVMAVYGPVYGLKWWKQF